MDETAQTYVTTLKKMVGDHDPMTVLSQTPSRISALIAGTGSTVLTHRPAPKKWSIAEILAHLADSEVVFGFRLRAVLANDGAPLQAFNPDRWAEEFDYSSADAHASAELFRVLRAANLRMIRSAGAASLDNVGRHEEWGSETARSMIHLEAGHDLNHLAQIQHILTSLNAAPRFVPRDQKPEIPLDAAEQVDLRIGTIVAVENVPGADRLVKLTVDFGAETRSVIAGIRQERADAQVLIGRQALFYYNLPRKKIRGHASEAMLCDAGFSDGILPALLQPEWPVPNGTRAG
jgi:methionine--tRNA ligase beta chain